MSPLHSSVSFAPYYYTLTCKLLCNLLLLVLAFSFVSPTKLHAPKQRQRFCLLLLCLPQCAVHGCECTALDGSDSAAFSACLGKAILNLILNFNKCDRWPQTKVSPNLAITPKTGIQSYLSRNILCWCFSAGLLCSSIEVINILQLLLLLLNARTPF